MEAESRVEVSARPQSIAGCRLHGQIGSGHVRMLRGLYPARTKQLKQLHQGECTTLGPS